MTNFPMKLLYRAVRPFKTKAATSERDRKLLPGENFLYDVPQTAETVRIDIDGFFYFIDRAIIETHCRFLGATRVDTGHLARLG
jgi:hypothetical protein